MQKLPVSAVLVLYNNADVIERALKSCVDIVDEIIVIHDGPCKDDTLEICRRYTDKVFVGERVGVAEPHRVDTYNMAKNDWILQLDGDEFLSEGLREHLGELISDPTVHGYQLVWPVLYKGIPRPAFRKTALVNKKYFYLIGCHSEVLQPKTPSVVIKKVPWVLEHRPNYENISFACFFKKWVPWAKVHARHYVWDFSEYKLFNCNMTKWSPRMSWRIQHPLLLGVCGSFIVHLLIGVKHFLSTGQFLFLKAGVLQAMYHYVLYLELWKLQRAKKKGLPLPV